MPSASSSGRRHSLVRDRIAMILLVLFLGGRRPILLLRLNRARSDRKPGNSGGRDMACVRVRSYGVRTGT